MNTNKPKKSLKQSVIQKIDAENVCPRSRLFFVCKETLVWIFWGLSVVVGALAVAVSLFVVTHSQYALYEAAHDNFFTFFVGALPYIWIGLFGIMGFLAVRNLQNTKRGYRYELWKVLASSLVVSLAGGAVLQLFGLGYVVDKKMGDEMAMYMSQEKIERQLWQAPTDGRLLGRQVLTTTVPTSTVVFEDSLGQRWTVDVSEMMPMDLRLLASDQTIRLLGTTSDIAAKRFHACGAFPWLLGKPMKVQELSAERQAFVDRVYGHKDRATERLAKLELATFAEDDPAYAEMMGKCAKIAPVRRIEASMY